MYNQALRLDVTSAKTNHRAMRDESTPSTLPAGYLCLVLHAHLPFVRHPEHPEFLEERWLFEAVRECYLPLIRILRSRDMAPGAARFTLSLSPTLMAMLDDDLLRQRTRRYLDRVVLMASREVARTAGNADLQPLARYYETLSLENRTTWDQLNGDIVGAFIEAGRLGAVELITTAATHAFLPLWRRHADVVQRQIEAGVAAFTHRVGHAPAGIWLPECGYYPGLETFLASAGLRYFFIEAHGIRHARPAPLCDVFVPVFCPNGVAAFGRDPDSSRQVWSADGGYPGDFDYREYYRDIGSTLPVDALKNIFPLAALDPATGFKYHRITGQAGEKEWYHPGRAAEKACLHATDFFGKKVEQMHRAAESMDQPPVVVAPYDAELFGHWWFEGPQFLEALLRLADASGELAMITPSDYLNAHPEGAEAVPAASTWGNKGYHDVWLNDETAWMYPHLFRAAERAAGLADEANPSLAPAMKSLLLHQAQVELMLAQASDWPFMIHAGNHVAYAEKRVRDHLARFYWLADALKTGHVDAATLEAITSVDRVFLNTAG